MAKKKIDPCIYNEVIVTEDFTRAIVQNDKRLFGLIELPSTKELTPFKYIKMSKFSSGRSVVYVDGKYGAIDLDGKEIISPMYEVMKPFYKDRAVAKRDGKVGIIDVHGNVIVDFIYDELPCQIEYGVFPMVKDGFHGVIDMDGKEIVPFIYDWCRVEIEVLDKYYIYASKGEEKTLYDMKGNKLFSSCKDMWVEYEKDYVIASEDGCKYGVLDLQGRVLIPFEYSKYFSLDKERGVFAMKSPDDYSINGKMVTTTFFDLDGKKLMHIPYAVRLNDDGIYVDDDRYGRKNNIGLYDYNGKILIPPINEILRHLEDKRYLVQERGQDVAYVLDLVTGKTTELSYKLYESVFVEPYAVDWFYIVTSKGKYGIVNHKLEVVVPIIYDKIGNRMHNKKYFEVTLDGKMGVLDTKGNLIIPFEYDKIDCLSKIEYAHIKSKRKFGYYNIKTGTETFFSFADNYPDIYPEKGFVVSKKNKYGFLDWAGNALGLPQETCEQKPKKKKIPTPICPFTEVKNFCEGFAAVQIEDKWGYIDTQGNLIHPIILEGANNFQDGHARVKGGKGLCINTKGEYDGYIDCGPIVYSRTPRGEHGYIYSKKEGNKVGWVNYAGKEVIPCIYDSDNRFGSYISLEDENQYIRVCLNKKYGIFNLRGEVILELEHDQVFERGGLWYSRINNKVALFAEDGRRLTPHKYDELSDFKGNILKSEVDGKFGFINKEGQEVVPIIYDDVKISSQGNYVILSLDNNSTMVSSDGKEICQLRYDGIDAINEEVGLAKVYKNNYYGFIDTKGNEVIPLKYCYAENFIKEYAKVKGSTGLNSNQHGLINAKGEEVVPLQYNWVGDFVNEDLGIIMVEDEKKVGIYDLINRKELIAPKYASCGKYSDGWLAVKSRGKWGFVDLEGNPLDYEWLKVKNK